MDDKYKYIRNEKFVGLLRIHYNTNYNELDTKIRNTYTPEQYYMKLKSEIVNYHTLYGPQSYI